MVNLECKFKHGNYILVCLTYLGNSVRRFFLALLPATALMPRLAAAGLGKNSPAGEKFSYEICRKIKFIVSLTNLKKKVAAGNYKTFNMNKINTKKNFTAYAGQSAGLLPQNFV